MHWAFTLQSGTLGYEAFFTPPGAAPRALGPASVLGDEADADLGGVWSHSYKSTGGGELKFYLNNTSYFSTRDVWLSAHIEQPPNEEGDTGKIYRLQLTKAPKGWTLWNKELLQ